MSIRSRSEHHRLASRLFTAVAVVMLLTGMGVAAYALTHQEHAPKPPASAAGTIGSPKTAPPSRVPPLGTSANEPAPTASPPAGPAAGVPASDPVAIKIPSIGVASDIIQVGLNADRTIEVPPPGRDYDKAAWYKYSPQPGQVGPSVIEGHVDSAAGGPSVFFKLGALRPGDKVEVTAADLTTMVFKVDGVREYEKASFPTAEIYGHTDGPELRIITCGGSFDRATGHYRSNVIAFASLVSRSPAP